MHGRPNGVLLPHQVPPQQVGVQVAQPMNDTQLVSLVAAQLVSGFDHGTNEVVAQRAVSLATEIVARSFVAVASGALKARIQEAGREHEGKGNPDPAA